MMHFQAPILAQWAWTILPFYSDLSHCYHKILILYALPRTLTLFFPSPSPSISFDISNSQTNPFHRLISSTVPTFILSKWIRARLNSLLLHTPLLYSRSSMQRTTFRLQLSQIQNPRIGSISLTFNLILSMPGLSSR